MRFFAIAMALVVGCQTPVDVHVWEPPLIQNGSKTAVGASAPRPGTVQTHDGAAKDQTSVVLVGIRGPSTMARAIENELMEASHRFRRGSVSNVNVEQTPPVRLISRDEVTANSDVRLVSTFDQTPSDMAIAAAARRHGHRYLLAGELIQANGSAHQQNQRIALTWRLTDLHEERSIKAKPISVAIPAVASNESETFFNPTLTVNDDQDSLNPQVRRELIEETLHLLWPSVSLRSVKLAKPVALPGSRGVRRGNLAARRGDWAAAERAYLDVLDQHPRNSAAWINAAVAAVAREDFTAAKQRITEAIRFSILSPFNRTLAEETLVWIEIHQKKARDAFGLPDPVGGYRVLVPTSASQPRR